VPQDPREVKGLVTGIGKMFLSDDGFGPEAARWAR
jgi:Ni,Fe-hydrogenase maturation factor